MNQARLPGRSALEHGSPWSLSSSQPAGGSISCLASTSKNWRCLAGEGRKGAPDLCRLLVLLAEVKFRLTIEESIEASLRRPDRPPEAARRLLERLARGLAHRVTR